MKPLPYIAISAVAAGGLAAAQNGDEDGAEHFDRTPQACISLNYVRETEIIDEQTLLFYMRGSRVYRNVLEHPCPQLDRRRAIRTTTRSNRLCSSDVFEPISLIGSQVFPGVFCRLGEFHPVTREEAALMELEPDELSVVRRTSDLTPIDPDELESTDEPATGSGDGAADVTAAPGVTEAAGEP